MCTQNSNIRSSTYHNIYCIWKSFGIRSTTEEMARESSSERWNDMRMLVVVVICIIRYVCLFVCLPESKLAKKQKHRQPNLLATCRSAVRVTLAKRLWQIGHCLMYVRDGCVARCSTLAMVMVYHCFLASLLFFLRLLSVHTSTENVKIRLVYWKIKMNSKTKRKLFGTGTNNAAG